MKKFGGDSRHFFWSCVPLQTTRHMKSITSFSNVQLPKRYVMGVLEFDRRDSIDEIFMISAVKQWDWLS